MTIAMTASGLAEINAAATVYGSDSIYSGYSECYVRITYAATVSSGATVVYGDDGNPNEVTLEWRRTNTAYYDTLKDCCHLYTYGIQLNKRFSDNAGDYSEVSFTIRNATDSYWLKAELAEDGLYYVTDHVDTEAEATSFVPNSDSGVLTVWGLEDDAYTIKEIQTDKAYTLLKQGVKVIISKAEGANACPIYGTDTLGLVQNDPRFASVPAGMFHNMPQRHLEHKLLTASATVDGNDVSMLSDNGSVSALAPFNVINTKGFDLPQTGSRGTWMYPVIGFTVLALCVVGIIVIARKRVDY
jgi:LPXTG-motif cell wall-anchored protein